MMPHEENEKQSTVHKALTQNLVEDKKRIGFHFDFTCFFQNETTNLCGAENNCIPVFFVSSGWSRDTAII